MISPDEEAVPKNNFNLEIERSRGKVTFHNDENIAPHIKFLIKLRSLNTKQIKIIAAIALLILIYIILFAAECDTYGFQIAGGVVGAFGATLVVMECLVGNNNIRLASKLLIWRALCDLGIGLRFAFNPLFNYASCGSSVCYRDDVDKYRCALPSAVMEFFAITSEAWFLCYAVDLFISITNPFSNSKARMKNYHIFCWGIGTLFAIVPLILLDKTEAYGSFFIDPKTNEHAFCWLSTVNNGYGNAIWFGFIMPVLFIYIICSSSLYITFRRLKSGLTKSFLPRIKLLVTNTILVFVLTLYWFVCVVINMVTYLARDMNHHSQALTNISFFTLASKGYVLLFVAIFISDNNLHSWMKSPDEESLDTNIALREEVLNFATAGIRSVAKTSSEVQPDVEEIIRRPKQARMLDSQNVITPTFFIRFVFGQAEEVRTVERMMLKNRRSCRPNAFQTLALEKERDTIALSAYQPSFSVVRRSSATSASAAAKRISVDAFTTVNPVWQERLSQRPTIVTTKSNLSSFDGGDKENHGPGHVHAHVTFIDDHKDSSTSDSAEKTSRVKSAESTTSRSGHYMDGLDSVNRQSELMDIADVESHSNNNSSRDETDSEASVDKKKEWALCGEVKGFVSRFIDDMDTVEFAEIYPYHFRQIRLSVGVTDEVFHRAFSARLKERLTEGGASGAFFFFSKGETFLAKSCTEEEANTLKGNAVRYSKYLVENTGTYLTRILGLYRLKIYGNYLHFFVMNNLFYNAEKLAMNEKYDIKGSWVNRNAHPPVDGQILTCSYCEQKFMFKKRSSKSRFNKDRNKSNNSTNSDNGLISSTSVDRSLKALDSTNSKTSDHDNDGLPMQLLAVIEEGRQQDLTPDQQLHQPCRYTVTGEHEPNIIMKDNDLKYKIRLALPTAVEVIRQLRMDADFLCSVGIMDYSLLVGVHNTEYDVSLHDEQDITGGTDYPRDESIALLADERDTSMASFRHTNMVSMVSSPSMAGYDPVQIGGGRSMSMHPMFATMGRKQSMASDGSVRMLRNRTKSVLTMKPNHSATATAGSAGGGMEDEGGYSTSPSMSRPSHYQDAQRSTSIAPFTHSTATNSTLAGLSSVGESLQLTKKLEVSKVVGPDAYFMGIIDYQQKWTLSKKIEQFFKTRFGGADMPGLSAIEPQAYRERFLRKIEDIIDLDASRLMTTEEIAALQSLNGSSGQQEMV